MKTIFAKAFYLVFRTHFWAFIAGGIFAWGLALSGMTQPQKIKGFLDFFGKWDPTMLFVLGVAVGVYMVAAFVAKKGKKKVWGSKFVWLEPEKMGARFFIGSAMFGVGWALVGLCPGPALVSLGSNSGQVILYVVSMLVGIFVTDTFMKRLA